MLVCTEMRVFYMDAAATYETHALKNAVRAAKRQKLPHGESGENSSALWFD